MTNEARFETRLRDLLVAYADRAPSEVDAMTVARTARQISRSASGFGFASRAFVLAAGAVALALTFIAGALVGGVLVDPSPRVRQPADRVIVEPFVGLPPVGIALSTPERGELVRSAWGIHPWYALYAYDDGRLISAFESSGPLLAESGWREQWLSRVGVDMLRSGAIVLDRSSIGSVDWMPAQGWSDTRIGAYAPARYAACLEDADGGSDVLLALDRLPTDARAVLEAALRVYDVAAGDSPGAMRCHDLRTADAVALDVALRHALVNPSVSQNWLVYELDKAGGQGDAVWSTPLLVTPLLPHGEWSWSGG